jgi:methylmalonyl-CoA mutase, N-terminal domain
VNCFTDDSYPYEVDGFAGGGDAWEQGMARLQKLRAERHERACGDALVALERTLRGDGNMVPSMLDALDADCSIGEVGTVLREVYGDWRAPVTI